MNKIFGTIFALFALVYLFTRVFFVDQQLEFFNDMGRDYGVLLDWKETFKPPLLGPQTSAFSFNQSPLYFYTLFPVFILSGQSPYSSIYTAALVYIVAFGLLLAWSYKYEKNRVTGVAVLGLLVLIHPETWRQTQFVWNPTFVLPLMLASLWAMGELWRRPPAEAKLSLKDPMIWILAGGATAATAFSYSTLPVILAQVFLLLFRFRKNFIPIFAAYSVTGFLWYIPFIAFELRHNFTLTWLLINGQRLPQHRLLFAQKFQDFTLYVLGTSQIWVGVLVLALLVAFSALSLHWYRASAQSRETSSLLSLYLALFAGSFFLSMVLPVGIESHYIFALCATLFILISYIHPKIVGILFAALCLIWLHPTHLEARFAAPQRTVPELQSCAAMICQSLGDKPVYVSMESGIIAYHNAPEHRYFLRQAGCTILPIEGDTTLTDTMVVIADSAIYTHGETAYEELTRFGSSSEAGVITCSQKLKAHVLVRE